MNTALSCETSGSRWAERRAELVSHHTLTGLRIRGQPSARRPQLVNKPPYRDGSNCNQECFTVELTAVDSLISRVLPTHGSVLKGM
ncbi:hypothetical protein Baya_2757 [Bagarius yarrelli]|uniref:Uncharacterized protein n=1 Tax=Bagarius yarrelli TaxID=175774 RepID=A0A556TQF9_BAGYA|nr:hypothetical protein Baya_2757 [Bagarius yarrelli]